MFKWRITFYEDKEKREVEIMAYTHMEAVKKANLTWDKILDVRKLV